MYLKTNTKISADELFNASSYKQIASTRDIIQAQKIVIEDEKSKSFISIFEIEKKGINVEKLITFSLYDINEENNRDKIRKSLLIEYLEKYANKEDTCISMNNTDADDFMVNLLNEIGYKQLYCKNPKINLFKK